MAAWLVAGGHSARADETTLIFATTDPGTLEINTRLLHPWADGINTDGAGVLRIDVRDGGAIANHANYYDRVFDDVVQIAIGQLNFISGKFPRSGIMNLPFLADSSERASIAFWRLYKTGMLDAEFHDIHPILFASLPQAGLHMAKPIPNLDKLDGLKIAAGAKAMTQALAAMGAAPSSLTAPDLYEGIQRRTIDGASMIYQGLRTFKLDEVTHFHVETPMGASFAMLFMTQKRYKALSPEAQKIMDAHSGETQTRLAGQYYDNAQKESRAIVAAESGQTIVGLTPAQTESWHRRIEPVTDDWVKATPDGAKILAAFKQILAEVNTGK
ncbi:MAG TPA: TRAP transporter substrate-binding protein [Stellaceae bacterium]|nr:TRAP transporter substrate-binding protein [Stellaceae bacterium]